MSKLDKTQWIKIHSAPKEECWRLLPANTGNDCSSYDGGKLPEETLDTLREIGRILEIAHSRMKKEGIKIPYMIYEKDERGKDNKGNKVW